MLIDALRKIDKKVYLLLLVIVLFALIMYFVFRPYRSNEVQQLPEEGQHLIYDEGTIITKQGDTYIFQMWDGNVDKEEKIRLDLGLLDDEEIIMIVPGLYYEDVNDPTRHDPADPAYYE